VWPGSGLELKLHGLGGQAPVRLQSILSRVLPLSIFLEALGIGCGEPASALPRHPT